MATATPTVETIKKITGVTLTLTLEEAVSLACILGSNNFNCYDIYSALDDALGGNNDYPDFLPNEFYRIKGELDKYIANMKTSL